MKKKWEVQKELRIKNYELRIGDIISILLENRGIKTNKEIEEFLHSKIENVTIESVEIDKSQIKKALKRIQKAIRNGEQIVVYGDYDVDGICGTAILWETLYSLGAKVSPYIPHRIDEGYGLSKTGIQNSKFKIQNLKLIITVDNGIVANDAVDFANKEGIDVIITDHHVLSKKKPEAFAIVHTTKLCGAGVAYLLSQEIRNSKFEIRNKLKIPNTKYQILNTHLELVALATVADLVPLLGANRILLKYGLENLRKTKRAGILELCKEAAINPEEIDVYKIGHMIAPRLNAMGRLEYAMESLRLLCTKSMERAQNLARILGETNRERQQLTYETVEHAITGIRNQELRIKKLLFIAHDSYQQGIIGLVAGRLVEEYYRPAIVVSKGEVHCKASARSIRGFNIIEFIRGASHLLVDAGGHPMAAGFTVETSKLALLQKTLEDKAMETISNEMLTRTLRIDCEIPLSFINNELFAEIQKLAPFGMGNPEPVFLSKGLIIRDVRLIGKEGKHAKFKIQPRSNRGQNSKFKIDGIGFGMGEIAGEFGIGDKVDVVYTVDENIWNGDKRLQLKIKDIKKALDLKEVH